ncbi:hypothetical protein B0H11DRAFT_324935 [Mycena galericulata]|nr:hypothetical protein B0H11DRAFT_324935 [Mycena galericulata]
MSQPPGGDTPSAGPPARPKAKRLARSASESPGTLRETSNAPHPAIHGSLTPLTPTPSGSSYLPVFGQSSPPSPTPREKGKAAATAGATRPASIKRHKSESSRSQVSWAEDDSLASVIPEPKRRLLDEELDEGENDDSSDLSQDNPDDRDYPEPRTRRKRTVVSQGNPSPKERKSTKSSIAPTAKRLATAADPNGGICLLTNAPHPDCSRQFCHVIARRTINRILTILEWWWQMAYWTLYIDTRFNIVPLRADWHLPMDADEWTLVPHHTLISSLVAWNQAVYERDSTGYNKNNRTPISESYTQTEFTYYFLGLSENMKKVALHRYPKDFDPTAVACHLHPFSTLGPLTSHIHPHFVVYSAGKKLSDLSLQKSGAEFTTVLENLADTASFGHQGSPAEVKIANLESLEDIMEIYQVWSNSRNVPDDNDRTHRWIKDAKALKPK